MPLAFGHTDWAVLSHLLRRAQREGWRVAFHAEGVEISNPAATDRIVVLPAVLLRHARSAGWHVAACSAGGDMALRHPAVQQSVRLRLRA